MIVCVTSFSTYLSHSAGDTGEANQPPSEGAAQRDGSDTTATEDAGLGQRQQGDGQSTAHLAAAGAAAGGGASQQTPPTTISATNGTQAPGVAPSSTDSSQQPGPGAYPPGFVPPPFPLAPPFMGAMPPPPAFFPSMPPFGFMGAPPPMGGECLFIVFYAPISSLNLLSDGLFFPLR